MKIRKLSEAVDLTPTERERVGLPSYIQRILPAAQMLSTASSLPVTVEKDDWELCERPRQLRRSFKFRDKRQVKSFVLEVLDLEEENLHSSLMQIDDLTVTICISTKVLQDVTQMDIDFAHQVDLIFQDVMIYLR